MIGLIGIDTVLPYKSLDLVGTLLFAEYPTTLVYSDNTDNPIIKEWVDSDENNNINRFFYYQVSKESLKRYINEDLPHVELINSSLEDYVLFEEVKDDTIIRTYIVSISSIPNNYKPLPDVYFNLDYGVDVIDVVDYFKLDDIDLSAIDTCKVKDISKRQNSELIYIHLQKGKGVGYGAVNSEVFAKTILNFDKFYKNAALDYVKGTGRGDIQLDAQKNSDLLQYTTTEIVAEAIRASYGFFIRPVTQQLHIDRTTPSEHIASTVFELLDTSADMPTFGRTHGNYSGFTMQAYKSFVDGIYKSELSLDINWLNPSSELRHMNRIDYKIADKIISNIDNLSVTGHQEINVKGKFRAVNCDTRHYSFISTDDVPYTGYFDKTIKEAAESVNFIDIYKVKIMRTITKDAARANDIIRDTIFSCYRDRD